MVSGEDHVSAGWTVLLGQLGLGRCLPFVARGVRVFVAPPLVGSGGMGCGTGCVGSWTSGYYCDVAPVCMKRW